MISKRIKKLALHSDIDIPTNAENNFNIIKSKKIIFKENGIKKVRNDKEIKDIAFLVLQPVIENYEPFFENGDTPARDKLNLGKDEFASEFAFKLVQNAVNGFSLID